MHPNEQLITDFYSNFSQKQAQKMAEAYHPEVIFKDEVFSLKGSEAGAMWQMLCEASGDDFKIEYKSIKADDTQGSAEWDAYYTFSRTRRKVHNKIKAKFQFKEGKIIFHEDSFNFWKWASQALGMTGLLLGWTSFLRKKVSATAQQGLKKFIAKQA